MESRIQKSGILKTGILSDGIWNLESEIHRTVLVESEIQEMGPDFPTAESGILKILSVILGNRIQIRVIVYCYRGTGDN